MRLTVFLSSCLFIFISKWLSFILSFFGCLSICLCDWQTTSPAGLSVKLWNMSCPIMSVSVYHFSLFFFSVVCLRFSSPLCFSSDFLLIVCLSLRLFRSTPPGSRKPRTHGPGWTTSTVGLHQSAYLCESVFPCVCLFTELSVYSHLFTGCAAVRPFIYVHVLILSLYVFMSVYLFVAIYYCDNCCQHHYYCHCYHCYRFLEIDHKVIVCLLRVSLYKLLTHNHIVFPWFCSF